MGGEVGVLREKGGRRTDGVRDGQRDRNSAHPKVCMRSGGIDPGKTWLCARHGSPPENLRKILEPQRRGARAC